MGTASRPRTVLITGCSDGSIGSALAIAFQQRGHVVFAGVRNPQKAPALSSLQNVTIVTLDITSKDSISKAVEVVRQHTDFKGLDVLINNAGQGVASPLLDADLSSGRDLFEVNFWGALTLIQAFAPLLIQSKGTIVNISSLGAVVNTPYLGLYSASKAALTLASDTLRLELQPLGVEVVTVMVGMVKTRLHDNMSAVVLPETSYYKAVEDRVNEKTRVEGGMERWQMSIEKFAEEVLGDVLKGHSGHLYKGGMSSMLRLFTWLLPSWVMVRYLLSDMYPGAEFDGDC